MEGNIVFREGDRVIYADRMYYDVTHHVGTVLNADILSPVPTYAGLLRVHADVVQQTASDRFFAENAFFTSSRMGEPSYRLQAGDVYFEDLQIADGRCVDRPAGVRSGHRPTGDPAPAIDDRPE